MVVLVIVIEIVIVTVTVIVIIIVIVKGLLCLFTTQNTTTTRVPSSFSPRSRATSKVAVRRALGLYFQQTTTARDLTIPPKGNDFGRNLGSLFL